MKKNVMILLGLLVACSFFGACNKESAKNEKTSTAQLMVGMATDSGTIDDRSFNQGTWEGILQAGKDFGIATKYIKPMGMTEADYLKAISTLYDDGYRLIVCPGFKFETAVYKAQSKYPDAKFVLIDGNAHPADSFAPANAPNTIGISFYENESGFLAGVAAALQIKKGRFGFIGGMELPAVQKFNWGWQQGIIYANEHLGTQIELKREDVVYEGSFVNVEAGKQIASAMYDKGVSVIHAAAGGVGVGVIEEAKRRAQAGEKVWVVGVDVDQYNEGLLPNGSSVILTSAMKFLDKAAYSMIEAEINGTFEGGRSISLSIKDDSVGIPGNNPNLSPEVEEMVRRIAEKIKSGEISVSAKQGPLIR